MAKLSARGRTELIRITFPKRETDSEYTMFEQFHYALMSDRRILRREVVWFKPGPYDHGKPQRHDYGWKQWKRYKPNVDLKEKVVELRAKASKIEGATVK